MVMSEFPSDESDVEPQGGGCSVKLNRTQRLSTSAAVPSTTDQVQNELPLLVYSYLKSSGMEVMADEFLKNTLLKTHPMKKYNLAGQPIDMSLEECKALADSIDTSRLTSVVSSMKGFIENAKQQADKDEAPQGKQTFNFSLITLAEETLCNFMQAENTPNSIEAKSCITTPHSSSRASTLRTNPTVNLARYLADIKITGRCDLKKLYSLAKPYENIHLLKRVLGHISAIYCFTLDRTKCTLVTGGEDGLIKLWNLEKCFLVATLRGHVKAVNDLSINHQNDKLASCGVDGTIRIWSLDSCALLDTLRNGHNCPVMSVCFSPYPVGRYRYLVSTGQNGTLCFYKIDHDEHIDPHPIKFAEKQPNKHFRINCFTVSPGGTYVALGVTDPTIRVYKMGIKGPVRTMELYGHSDEVESVEFDSHGSRFCSGSKDGTVCIWTLSITSWRCAQIEVKKDMLLTSTTKVKPPGSKKKSNFAVNLVSWSCDNLRICCACADYVIRAYDSCSRKLISRMSVHTDKVTVIEHHPKVGNLLLSSGCDGKIHLWDSDNGTIVVSLDNNLGEQGFGSVYDLAFVARGRDFVMCDYHGNWALYSTLPCSIVAHIPDHQFFHSDYWEIQEDPDTGKVVDVNTLLEPHLMPPPLMVNYFGIPFNNEVQKLIPGASLLNKETEFNCDHISVTNNTSVFGPGLATSGSVEGVRKTGIINKKSRCNLKFSHLMWFRRWIVNQLSQMDIDEDVQMRLGLYKHEQSIHNNVRQKNSKFFDKEERIGRLLRLQSIQKERQLEKQARRVVALPLSANTDEDEDSRHPHVNYSNDELPPVSRHNTPHLNQPSLYGANDGDEYDETFQYFSALGSERNSDPEFVDESDEFFLEDTLPTRTNRTARLRSLRPRNSTGSTVPNGAARRRNGIVTRSNGPHTGDSSGGGPQLDDAAADSVEEVVPPIPDDYPSTWVSSDRPKITPYVPQMGDQVYYFVQGHRLYLQELFQQNLTQHLPSVNAYEEYDRFISAAINPRGYELCRVVDIHYIYKNPLVCKIKLKRLEIDQYANLFESCDGAYKKEHFVLEFHDMANILDFIVLREVVDTAVKRDWSAGCRFKSVIDDCWWYGSVESCSAIDAEFPESPHLSCAVRWDTGEYDRISPWDMEVIDMAPRAPRINRRRSPLNAMVTALAENINADLESTDAGHPLDSSTHHNQNPAIAVDPIAIKEEELRVLYENYIVQTYRENEQMWGGEHPFDACERIANAIEKFKNHYIAYAFSMPVDLATFVDYWTVVPHPMDLSKVVRRLRNHYYRSKEAVVFDVKLIKLNALSYNRSGTPISQCACTLFTLLEELIANKDLVEIDLKHPLLAGKRYPTDVSGPSTIKSSKRSRRRKLNTSHNHYSDESEEEQHEQRQHLTRNLRIGSNEMMVKWINDAFDLLNYLMQLKDSECFLHPVDLEEYPEYTQFVKCPMDFNMVLNKLKSGTYIHPVEMIDDIKLIFSNSRTFNTNPRSKIYSMTARLSNQFMLRSESFLNDWANIAPLKRPLTRSIIRNIYNNYLATQNQNNGDTAQPTSSRRARMAETTHSPQSDHTRPHHKYSLRRSDVSLITPTVTTRDSSHYYATRNSHSSYSPAKRQHSENNYEFDEEISDFNNNSSFFDETSIESNDNSNHRSNKKTKYSYKTHDDADEVSLSNSFDYRNSKNKSNTRRSVVQARTAATASRRNPTSPQQESDHDDKNPHDQYFGNVSPIATGLAPIRRSHRIRKRRSFYDDSPSITEEPHQLQNSKYNLRRSKRRFS